MSQDQTEVDLLTVREVDLTFHKTNYKYKDLNRCRVDKNVCSRHLDYQSKLFRPSKQTGIAFLLFRLLRLNRCISFKDERPNDK